MQGERHHIRSKLKRDLRPAVITNWQIWVPFQFVNFRFIPLHLQARLLANVNQRTGKSNFSSWLSKCAPRSALSTCRHRNQAKSGHIAV